MDAFDAYLGARYGRDKFGADAVEHLIRQRVLEVEIEKRGVRVDPRALERAIAEADAQIRARDGRTLEEELAAKSMSRATFEGLFRQHLACEQLVRDDMSVPEGEPVRPEQQELWLSDRVKAARVERPGLAGDPVAVVEGAPIRRADVGRAVRFKLSRSELRDALRAAVGIRLVEARARELSIETTPERIEQAIARRRERFAANSRLDGVTFEQFLQARGLTVDDLRADSGVRGEALLAAIAARTFPDDEVDRRYAAAKDRWDGLFGPTRHVSWVLLQAVTAPNPFVARTYAEADRELTRLAEGVKSIADFGRIASIYSTHAASRSARGELGWLHRLEPGIDAALLEAAFRAEPGKVFGPVRTGDGSALVWVREERPGPDAPALRALLRNELANDLYRSLLEEAKITTYLDPVTAPAASSPAPPRR